MKNLIKEIFERPELIAQPPVLIDVGASGKIHPKWKLFAKYAICIAFDADDREFNVSEKESKDYKKLYIYNCIVSDKEEKKIDFYLTEYPYTSSSLKPDNKKVEGYIYAPFYKVKEVVELDNISLRAALTESKINKIDWMKVDSQGIDLRLYKNLDEDTQNNILLMEFEPGIHGSYEGEDKLFDVMRYMDNKNFWLADINVNGVPRISRDAFDGLFSNSLYKKLAKVTIKKSPRWAEITYINSFKNEKYAIREFLLGCVFCMVNNEYLNAISLAEKGESLFNDEIFQKIIQTSKKGLVSNFWNFDILKGEFLKKLKGTF
ncbi:MAG: FkbM family methyltransferase [Flammeovirgaceae bacterium]|nr:FkbM family methyltransferase [Flammeovirgaceae bacterium]